MAGDRWNADGNTVICTTHVIFIKASRRLIYFFPQRRGKGGTDKKKIKKCKGEKDARTHDTTQQPPKQDRELSKTSAMWSENHPEVK